MSILEPFTKAEMEAIRRALGQGEGSGEALRRGFDPRAFLDKVGRLAGRLPFAEDLVAAYHCTRDPATPARVRLVLLSALAYFVLPLDAVPDLLPGAGLLDDAAVLAAALAAVAGAVTDAHRERARATLSRPDILAPGEAPPTP